MEIKEGTKITLCGSTKFKEEYENVNKWLTLKGCVVYSVSMFGHSDHIPFTDKEKELLDLVHKWKIDNSDEIFVIDVNSYIGSSTKSEIEHAKKTGKPIRYLSDNIDEYETFVNNWYIKPEPKKDIKEIFKNCKDGKFCCEGQLYLYNAFETLIDVHSMQGHPFGDLECEIWNIRGLLENCPFCDGSELIDTKRECNYNDEGLNIFGEL